MKKLLSVAIFLSLCFAGFSQQNDKKNGNQPVGPVIRFDSTVHDFGNVPEGPKAVHGFTFYNKGDKPLLIKYVQASCGCTVPTWPRNPIMPGEKGYIYVAFDTEGRGGKEFAKDVFVISNAGGKDVVLFIKGYVVKADMEKK